MSQNIEQIFVSNPAAAMITTDLLYLGRSPFAGGDDFAITWANMQASINTLGVTSIVNAVLGYTTTATAATLTTLTNASTYQQFFTGSTTQTVKLPVTSTLALGWAYYIVNNSSGAVTVESSGGNTIQVMAASSTLLVTCILTSGTSAASWNALYYVNSDLSGAVTHILTDSGTANPSSGAVTITGGSTGLTTTGATSVVTLTGILTLANGGTNQSLTASNGGIFYSTASAGAILAGTATANQVLLSGASTTPAWSTATYPPTTTINQLLYSSSANVVGGLATVNNASLSTNATGVPTWLALTVGQIVIGSSAGAPLAATITPGAGISIANGNNTITISSPASAETWFGVSGTTQAAAVNSGYVIQNASQTTVTLPATAALGSIVSIQGLGAAGWVMAANTGQTIQNGATATSSGGTLTSAHQYDTVKVVCIVANTTWSVSYSLSSGLVAA